jgi:zinc transport system ATP-binding protein
MKVFELIDPLFLPHCGCELQLSVNKGKALVLIGENGLGKTTLLHRFYLDVPSESRVVVEQKTSEYFFDRKLKTIKQFFLEADLKGFNQEAFHTLWNAFDLSSKEERLISNLSGGESQALKLCMSLCKEAEYYFLDEPSQYLDEAKKKVLLQFLQKLLLREKTLLLVEHNRDWLPSGWDIQELKIENNTLKQGAKWTT